MTAIAERFDVGQERARLEGMHMADLRRLARTACGYESRTRNRHYLIRRILWSLQAAARGGLSERATALVQNLVQDLAHGDDVRARPRRAVAPGVEAATPAPAVAAAATPTRDERLPRPGHAIVRRYQEFKGARRCGSWSCRRASSAKFRLAATATTRCRPSRRR